jgi:hypothetical protein
LLDGAGSFFAFLHQVALDESAELDAAKAKRARDPTALNKIMTVASSEEPKHTTEHAKVTVPSLSTAVRSLFSRLVGKVCSANAGSGAAIGGKASSANAGSVRPVLKEQVFDASV